MLIVGQLLYILPLARPPDSSHSQRDLSTRHFIILLFFLPILKSIPLQHRHATQIIFISDRHQEIFVFPLQSRETVGEGVPVCFYETFNSLGRVSFAPHRRVEKIAYFREPVATADTDEFAARGRRLQGRVLNSPNRLYWQKMDDKAPPAPFTHPSLEIFPRLGLLGLWLSSEN